MPTLTDDRPDKGRVVEQFRIAREIGRGGMGVVYLATDTALNRPVALKMLPGDVVGSSERRARFMREARMAAAVNHENIATVYEVGEADGQVYIALEYVDGQSLREAIAAGGLDEDRALTIASEIAEGLAAAHAGGVIHRDLKPGNVMLNQRGVVKLLDFGLAKSLEAETGSESEIARQSTGVVSETGAIQGTPAYMSPEQCRGAKVDKRTDVFSFGTLLYELLSKHRPFVADNHPELGYAIMHDDPPPPKGASPELTRIIERCMQKTPAERFADGAEVATALGELRAARASSTNTAALSPPRPARRWPLALAAAAVAVAAAAWWLATRSPDEAPTNTATETVAEVGPPPRALTEIRFPERVVMHALSRDGARIVYLQAGKGVFIEDITEGTATRVPDPEGISNWQPHDFFPDGRLLVSYFSGTGPGIASLDLTTSTLEPIDLGPLPPEAGDVRVSPDGTRIAGTSSNGLSIAPATGGTPTLLRPVAREAMRQRMAWSPDGRHIAVTRADPALADAIELVSVDGAHTEVIPVGPGLSLQNWKMALAWLPDGRILYGKDADDGGTDLWQVSVPDGSWDQEPPERFTHFEHGLMSELHYGGGRIAFLSNNAWFNVHVTGTDKRDVPLGATQRLTDRSGWNFGVTWTTDGRLVLVSNRDGSMDVFTQRPDGDPEELAGEPDDEIAIAAAGDRVLLHRIVPGTPSMCHTYRVDPDGERSLLFQTEAAPGVSVSACPSIRCAAKQPHRCIAIMHVGRDTEYRELDPDTGELSAPLVRTPRRQNQFDGISPDGTRLAWAEGNFEKAVITVLDLATGSLTKVAPADGFIPHDVSWTTGGDAWVVSGGFGPGRLALAIVRSDGSLNVLVDTGEHLVHDPVMSLDGASVAFRHHKHDHNVWILELGDP
jgi:dipeptidyl aminopeptidase/acylaminoacyl peptidase/predicted Ser/Thr protein kinase